MSSTSGAFWLSKTLGPLLPETLNVKNFGAVGDGVANDAAAFQAAMDAAFHGNPRRPLHVPAGVYNIGSTLNLVQVSGIWWFGAGSDKTTLRYVGPLAPAGQITSLIRTNGANFGSIEGMTLDISGPDTIALNLDCVPGSGQINVNGMTMIDIVTKNATTGMAFGLSGLMGSEMAMIDCQGHDHAFTGTNTLNGNALGEQFYNCKYVRCGGYDPAAHSGYGDVGGAIYTSAGNNIIIAGTQFEDSGFIDISSVGGESKIVIDVVSTNSRPKMTPPSAMSGPSLEFKNNMVFYQNVSFSAPNALGHAVVQFLGNHAVFRDCNFPDGGPQSQGPGFITYTANTIWGNPDTFDAWLAGGNSLVQSPTTDTITPLVIDYSIPDFVSEGEPPPPPPPPAPTVTLTANPTSIQSGQTAVLSWSSTNATSTMGTGFSTGGAVSGSVTVSPTNTTTYSITATGAGGTANASVTVTVTAPPPPPPPPDLVPPRPWTVEETRSGNRTVFFIRDATGKRLAEIMGPSVEVRRATAEFIVARANQ